MKIYAFLFLSQTYSVASLPQQNAVYTLHDFRDYNGKAQLTITSHGDGTFAGSITAPLGTSTFDSIVTKKSIEVNGDVTTRKLVASSSVEAQSIKVEKSIQAESAKFESALSVGDSLTSKNAIVRGILNVTSGFSSKGPIYATSFTASGSVEAKSMEIVDDIKAKKLSIMQDITSEGKVTSAGGFFSKDGVIKAKELESNQLKVTEIIAANRAEFQGDITVSKKTQMKDAEAATLSISNQLDVSAKGSVYIDGALMSKGQASFVNGLEATGNVTMNRVSLWQLEMVYQQGNRAPTIDASKGSIVADQLKVNTEIKADSVTVGKGLTAQSLFAKDLQVSGSSEFGSVECKNIKSNSMAIHSITANLTTIEEKLIAKSVQVSDSISVKGNVSLSENMVAENASLSGGLSAKSISAETLSVEGKVNISDLLIAQKIQSDTDIIAMGKISAKGGLTVEEGIDVRGRINGSSIFVGDLAIGGPSKLSQLGCMNISSDSGVVVGGNLMVTQNVSIDEYLFVRETIRARNISTNKIVTDALYSLGSITSGSINVTQGNVTSSDGFFSDGDMIIGNVAVAGNLSVNSQISASAIQADKTLSAGNASVNYLSVITNLKVGNRTTFEGEAEFGDLTFFHGKANFTGEYVSMNKLMVQNAEIKNGLEVGSLFTKRVYAQDIAATGFVTATSLISKSDVNVTGTISSSALSTEHVTSKYLSISNELHCSTARVDGVLDAAGIATRKLTIKGGLVVNDVDLIAVVESMEKRITDLEQKMASLHSDHGVEKSTTNLSED